MHRHDPTFIEKSSILLNCLRNDIDFSGILSQKNQVEKNLIHLVEKISVDIYSRNSIAENKEWPLSAIKNVVAGYLVKKAVAMSLLPDDFDYQSATQYESLYNTSMRLKKFGAQKISQSEVTIEKESAKKYLIFYKEQLTRNQKVLHILQKNNNPELLNKLDEVKRKINDYASAIKEIETSTSSLVRILFPPVDSFTSITSPEFPSILNIESPTDSVKIIQNDIKNKIAVKHALETSALRSVKNIGPQYNLADITTVLDCHDQKIAAEIARTLIFNLLKKIEEKPIKIPLDIEIRNSIKSFLLLFQTLNGKKNSNSHVRELLTEVNQKISIKNIKEVLRNNEKTVNYELLHENYNNEKSPTKILNNHEEKFLQLFDSAVIQKNKASYEELKYLAIMLEKSIGNARLNKSLSQSSRQKSSSGRAYAITDIKYFSFKTRFNNSSPELLIKCKKALEDVRSGKTIDTKNKISLFEFGRLEDIAKLKSKLDEYAELGIVGKSKKLSELHRYAIEAENIFTEIQQLISKEAIYKDGDIVMTHSKKSLLAKHKKADLETYLTHNLISKYGHAMQVYIDHESKTPKLSHIYGSYQSDEMHSSDITTADTFRIDACKLISPAMQSKLKTFYSSQGKDFKDEINKLYQSNIQRLHSQSQKQFQLIENDKIQRFKAGLADYRIYGGHTNPEESNRQKVRDAMYERNGYKIRNKMICSEFVARSITAALFETNELLTKELIKEGVINSEQTEVIRMPFKKEKIQKIHPERLINLLIKEECLEKVEHPSILSALINDKNKQQVIVKDKKKQLSSEEFLYKKLVKLSSVCENESEFIKRGMKATQTYAHHERMDLNFKDDSLFNFLHTGLKDFYTDIKKPSPTGYYDKFIAWLKQLGSKFGIVNKSSTKFLISTVNKLEKVQYNANKSKHTTIKKTANPEYGDLNLFSLFSESSSKPSINSSQPFEINKQSDIQFKTDENKSDFQNHINDLKLIVTKELQGLLGIQISFKINPQQSDKISIDPINLSTLLPIHTENFKKIEEMVENLEKCKWLDTSALHPFKNLLKQNLEFSAIAHDINENNNVNPEHRVQPEIKSSPTQIYTSFYNKKAIAVAKESLEKKSSIPSLQSIDTHISSTQPTEIDSSPPDYSIKLSK
jgi:hypothetical protein